MRRTRWQRTRDLWLDMPGIVRVGMVLALAIVIATCAGCARLSHPSASMDVVKMDDTTCAATGSRYCIAAIWLYLKARIE